MRRRSEVRAIVAVVCAALLGVVGFVAPCSASAKPNVLFIAVDDLNDWIGVLGGHPQALTPHIDALAERGVLFTNAHGPAPLCNPSRSALLTGIHPSTSGLHGNLKPFRSAAPLADAVTIPQHFRNNGYRAMGSGKIFHDQVDAASWDAYAPSLESHRYPSPVRGNLDLNELGKGRFDWGRVEVAASEMSDHRTADYVISQLSKPHDQPFFLACGIFLPHLPWYLPEAYYAPFPLAEIELPAVATNDLSDVPPIATGIAHRKGDHEAVLEGDVWRAGVQSYLAAISFADEQVGRVIAALDASPHRTDTIIVLWSDHGWHLGEKEHWRKYALWEDTTRVPLIFVVPEALRSASGIGHGLRSNRVVSLIDIYPTLIELAGLPPREELDGESLVPLLRDPRGADWDRFAIATTFDRSHHAIRSDRFRYIRYEDGTEELYDHADDPNEWTNLASRPEHADLKQKLQRFIPEPRRRDDD